MKKEFLLLSSVLLTLIVFSGQAWADPITNVVDVNHFEDILNDDDSWAIYDQYQNSGIYIGYFDGNDSISTLEAKISYYLQTPVSLSNNDVTVTYTGWNGKDLVLVGTSDDDDGKVDIGGDYISGTWYTTPDTAELSFYSIKAADGFALYQVSPADNSGSWSTYDIFKKGKNGYEISHYTGILADASGGGTTPNPEPSTILLFGFGLLGLSRMYRRKE